MNIKTQGVIIAKRDFSEGDRIFWILTPDKGLIMAFAKGVRKILSRLSGYLGVGNILDLSLYKGKTFYTITEVENIQSASRLKKDLEKTSILYHFCELIKIFLPLESKHEEIFPLFVGCVNILARHDPALAKIFFELKLIDALGFGFNFYHCSCGKKFKQENNFFSLQEGVLCQSCATKDVNAVIISDSSIKLGRWIILEDPGNIPRRIIINPKIIYEVEKILAMYLEFLAEKKLHTLDFIKQVKKT